VADSEGALVEWLGAADSGPEELGGKGASLDRLLKLGYRVPPGFCVTTTAFRRQRAASDDSGSEVVDLPLDGELRDELAASVARLVDMAAPSVDGVPRFAIRSSAVGEDGSTASFAGLHETELGVGPEDVGPAVRRCWASLWSAPAIAYRARRGLPDADAAMATVVQALVPAEASAVAFTRHPVTGRDDQVVVTTSRGLGDAMVSGTVTPDTYVIDRATRAVVAYERGDEHVGGALEESVVVELVDLCLRVEMDLGRAVDIEAARTAGRWFLLQARPITTA
jgi:rifampicin phosphotransferase